MAVFRHLFVVGRTSFLKPRHNLTTKSVNISIKSRQCTAYEPDGKSVVKILNNEEGAPLMINKYSVLGFRLNNGLFVVGPVALFPQSILSWNIKDDNEINEKSLSLFMHLAPRLDVLVIGLSDSRDQKLLNDVRRNVHLLFRSRKCNVNIEVLPTEKAVTTFNFLNSESRFVAAAMLPPTFYSPTLDDEYLVEYLSKKKDNLGLVPEVVKDKLKIS